MTRRSFIATVGVAVTASSACSSEDTGSSDGSGGQPPPTGGGGVSTGGTSPATGGVADGTGGTTPTGGAGAVPTGGTATGGVSTTTGGAATGGETSTGGTTGGSTGGSTGGTSTETGGSPSTGGALAETGGAEPTTGGSGTSTGGTETGTGGEGGGGSTDTPLVALVRGTDWAAATEDAIARVGGLPDLTGLTVLLRPNVISSDPPPTTTNPEVVRGVIRAARQRGATTIYVADDGWATGSTVTSMNDLGIGAVCTEEGATPLDLKDGSTTNITHPNATAWPNGMNFYDAVLNADYVINIPVCKSHALANYTMALKAWYGHVPQSDRNHANLASQLAELHLAKQEDFVVLDATRAMVTGGPQTGDVAEPRIVVATPDAIAADVTGLCIHKHFGPGSGAVFNLGVWEQQQVQRALELAFPGWLSQPTEFPYQAEGIDEHAEIMARRIPA